MKKKTTMLKSELRKRVQEKMKINFKDTSSFCVELYDYKKYFDKSYKIPLGIDEGDEFMDLSVWSFENENDNKWEYSIIYYNHDDGFAGVKTGINTSSEFALMSCNNWEVEDEDSEDEETIFKTDEET